MFYVVRRRVEIRGSRSDGQIKPSLRDHEG